MKNISDRIVDKTETHILCPITFIFQKTVPFMRLCGNVFYTRTCHSWKYGACWLYGTYLLI